MPEFNGASTMSYSVIFDRTAQFVDIETVGISTGLKDKNSVEIYEGDIVIGSQDLITGLLTPTEVKGIVKYSSENTMFYLEEKNSGHDKFIHSLGSSIYRYEVLGNIHENPELLEVAE
ncbi:hypothetical protein RV10_GL003669 [Enterococcus pallens]|nr:hypothetical protein RV10_GL003669 [Enterococcus pallens]